MKSKMDYSPKAKTRFLLFQRREKILQHNNDCILKTVISYEKIFLDIIRQTYFNDNSINSIQLTKFLRERMSFMDRFKIVKEIGTQNGINAFSANKIDRFIKKRNNIAHNLSSIYSYHINSDEMDVNFGGEYIEWKIYLKEMEEWAEISCELAKYTKKVFQAINKINKLTVCYHYCTFEKSCILVPNMLIPDDLDIEISNNIETKINKDLLQVAKDEEEYIEKKNS